MSTTMAHHLAIVTSSGFRHTSKCFGFSFYINGHKFTTSHTTVTINRNRTKIPLLVTCSSAKPSSSTEISSQARIRSEVLTPFRSVRMFFYIAFVAQASLGGLIATTQLIGALSNPARADSVIDIAKGLGIDVGAAALFGFLYNRENKIKNAQMARLSREENLSNLKLRVDEKKIITVSEFRGLARLVILAGPSSFITEAFKRSETFTEQLIERGVLVVPFSTDGNAPEFEFDETDDSKDLTNKRKRLWQLVPVLTPEWSDWLDDQKKLANVSPESPVYLSLRLDGRVRGSGVGYPPWNAFVAQLPPVKGMWSGLLDGMDGRFIKYLVAYHSGTFVDRLYFIKQTRKLQLFGSESMIICQFKEISTALIQVCDSFYFRSIWFCIAGDRNILPYRFWKTFHYRVCSYYFVILTIQLRLQ